MKKTLLSTLTVLFVLLLTIVSCGKNASAPKTSLSNETDSLSYAYGVALADQGLVRFLEQVGVLENSSLIENEYQSKLIAADSLEKPAIAAEMQHKLDSINKINAPRLNDFIKGVKTSFGLEEGSAYAYGLSIGVQFSQQMVPQIDQLISQLDTTQKANKSQVMAGLINYLKNNQLAISAMESNGMIQQASQRAQELEEQRREEELKTQYADSISAYKAFLEENGKREEVVTLPSGLQYEIIKEGKGAIPTDTNRVKVHYHGTLINGKVFDSSVDRGEPSEFGVNQVIPGWTEALKLMPVGSKWRLYIPYDLAYGSSQQGEITPFSTLIFDVELLDIVK